MYVTDRKQRTAGMDKIYQILDRGSFMEIGEGVCARTTAAVADGSEESAKPSDGVITGYGTIGGRLVYLFSQDGDVMGGTFGEAHGEKIRSLYRRALKTKAPIIGLLDCNGFRIEEGASGLEAMARLYRTMARAGKEILQIMAVYGNCGGGMSIAANLADFLFVEKKGKLYVNSPAVVDSGLREVAGQEVYTDGEKSADEISKEIRKLIQLLPAGTSFLPEQQVCDDDLNRICPELIGTAGDGKRILQTISDQHFFLETRPQCGRDLVTGFLRLNGMAVGGLACSRNEKQDGRITAEGLDKAERFVRICDKLNLPILTLIDTEGFDTDATQEQLLPAAAHRLLMTLTEAEVPKINLICGQTAGTAYSLLGSKGLGADYVFMWDTARVRLLNTRQAVEILYPKATMAEAEEKAADYEARYCSGQALAARGYVDKVIQPQDSRKYLIGALETFANLY